MTDVVLPNPLTPNTLGQAAHVQGNDAAIASAVNGLTADNFTAASITDASLASPNNMVWRPIASDHSYATRATMPNAGQYVFNGGGGGTMTEVNTHPLLPNLDMKYTQTFTFDSAAIADLGITGKTAKIRLIGTIACNSISPGSVTISFSFNRIWANGLSTSGQLGYTRSPGITASTGSNVAPVPGQVLRMVGTAITVNVANLQFPHFFQITTTQTPPIDCVLQLGATLELRHE